MKKPPVDYRNLRLSNITSLQYRHLLLLLGWIVYFILYFLTERLIPAQRCHVVWCPLDDVIPFCEWFVIPYVGWYGLIVFSLGYFIFYDVESFKSLQKYFIIVQIVATACYILFPTRQDLRPAEFPRENILTDIMGLIYAIDTNTGVCPSLHVACSVGIASAWLKQKDVQWHTKLFIVLFAILVCLSVTFTKQHSVMDILAAVPVCILAEGIVFGKSFWRKRLKNKYWERKKYG